MAFQEFYYVFFNWRESLIEVEENKLFFLSLRYSIVLFIDTFAFTLGQKISACCYRYDFYHFIFCQKAAAAIAKEGAQYLVQRDVRTFSASSQRFVIPLHHFSSGQARDRVVVPVLFLVLFVDGSGASGTTSGTPLPILLFIEGAFLSAQTFLGHFMTFDGSLRMCSG